MRRPPPTSTLFPYTTLFRSRRPRRRARRTRAVAGARSGRLREVLPPGRRDRRAGDVDEDLWSWRPGLALEVRSEEHTSELQSLTNLVCRLLLEKKKQKERGD